MVDLVSIILPMFNAQNYITDTVNSIVNQTYINWELIILDDGSSDNSGMICQEFSRRDDRVKYIKRDNRGICAARNEGLSLAQGNYICFCDHDDIYEPDFLEEAIGQIRIKNTDVICAAYKEIVINNQRIVKQEIRTPVKVDEPWTGENIFFDYMCYQHTFTTVWNCMYKAEAVKEIRFDERLKYGGEDILFNLQILESGKTVGKSKHIAYRHFKRYGKSTSSKFNQNRIDSLVICMNAEKNIMNSYYDAGMNLLHICEAYYLGGIIKLCISSNNRKRLRSLLQGLENKNHKWSYDFRPTKIGIKYDLIYFLFCNKWYNAIWILSAIKK